MSLNLIIINWSNGKVYNFGRISLKKNGHIFWTLIINSVT